MRTGWRHILDRWFDQSDRLSLLLDPLVWPRLGISDADREILFRLEGVPLYVFKAASELDYQVFNILLGHLDQPVPRVHFPSFLLVSSTDSWASKLVSMLLPSREAETQDAVSRIMRSNPAYVALLEHNPAAGQPEPLAVSLFEHLLSELDQHPGAPKLVAVPVCVIWNKKGVRTEEKLPLLKRILGDPDVPGRLRVIGQLLSSLGQPTVKIGQPLSLADFREATADLSGSCSAIALAGELGERIEHEWRIQLGPRLRDMGQIQQELARNPEVKSAVHQAIRDGMTPRQAKKELRAALAEIPASPGTATLAAYKSVLKVVWTRLYRGFDVDQDGFSAMREAARKGPLLLLPCHRSHMDYLILSWLMERYDLPIPHIAAGKNLSFWPMGPIFRRGGAFFIRRSFKGNRLYKTILVEYLANLLRQGINIEFFPEGTRSRTGKAVYPRTGLLAMIAELVVTRKVPSPQIVPIAIGYEKVVEEGAYLQEMEGQTKQAENLTQLFRAAAVVLNRYGRVNVQVAEPFDMAEYLGLPEPGSPEFKSRVDQLALEVIARIVASSVVTPSMLAAAALLVTGENMCELAEVEERFEFFRQLALACQVKLSRPLLESQSSKKAFRDALKKLGHTLQFMGSRVLVLQNRRGTLAYYRNGFSQTVITAAISAAAMRSRDPQTGQWLRHCLKREFPQLSLAGPSETPLVAEEFLKTCSPVQLHWMAGLYLDLVESQALTCARLARGIRDKTIDRPMSTRQLTQEVRTWGKGEFRRGRVWRPEALGAQSIAETVEWLADEGFLERDDKGRNWRFASPATEIAQKLHRQAKVRQAWLQKLRKSFFARKRPGE